MRFVVFAILVVLPCTALSSSKASSRHKYKKHKHPSSLSPHHPRGQASHSPARGKPMTLSLQMSGSLRRITENHAGGGNSSTVSRAAQSAAGYIGAARSVEINQK
jgi:hypothetical protein